MNDSTRRTIRTVYQTAVALLTAVPIILVIVLDALPEGSDLKVKAAALFASVLAGVAAVTKIITALEDRGIIPAWLKADPEPIDPETADAPEPDFGDHEAL